MKQRGHKDLFVYMAESEPSPFVHFLSYTDEKENLSKFLAQEIITQSKNSTIKVLDVGCGDASLATSAIARSECGSRIEYIGIEPAGMNVTFAEENLKKMHIEGRIINDYFDEDKLNGAFDLSIASNLYHLEMDEIPSFLQHLRRATSSFGYAYFIYRGESDDILKFRREFEPLLHSEYKQPRTMRDVRRACKGEVLHSPPEAIHSKLIFPESRKEREKLFEFILNISVGQLNRDFIENLHRYVEEKKSVFHTQQVVIKIKGTAQ